MLAKMVWLPLVLLVSSGFAASSFSLSNTLGDHMVLQRAPQQAVLWGFANPGVVVQVLFNGNGYNSPADASGVWRVTLPPVSTAGPWEIKFSSSDGGSATLSDVLFGDVYLCGGQSNMQMTVSLINNATAEIQSADKYPSIRVFTVGQGTASDTPLSQLATIEQYWQSASQASIGGADWAFFSGVCWLFGRQISDALGGKVPIGLISNNWGGTSVQQWSSSDALKTCGASGSGNLWNAMIVPYTIGPMSLLGITWYQGEANVGQDVYYSCQFPAMISDWRAKFNSPKLWFGFVQIAGYNYGPGPAPGDLRQAQLSALALPAVGYSTAVDVGNAFDIHPTDKQTVSSRLANSALTMIYSISRPWQFPLYSSSSATTVGNQITVKIAFQPGTLGSGLTTSVPSYAAVMGANVCVPGLDATECGFPTITINDAQQSVLNATASISSDGQSIIFSTTSTISGAQAIATSYGRASWPVTTFFNSYGLPVIPWYQNVTFSTVL